MLIESARFEDKDEDPSEKGGADKKLKELFKKNSATAFVSYHEFVCDIDDNTIKFMLCEN